MRNTVRIYGYTSAAKTISVWNQRLLTVAFVVILWAASMLALQVAGPDERALLAGEGMLIAGQR